MEELNRIEKIVCAEFKESRLSRASRERNLVDARRCYAMIARDKTSYSLNTIGKHIGKDHCLALHYIKSGKTLLETDGQFKRMYESCNSHFPKTSEELQNKYDFHISQARRLRREIQQQKQSA